MPPPQPDAPAMPFAARYLRLRSLSLVPALVSAVAFGACRGTLDVASPLKVSISAVASNNPAQPRAAGHRARPHASARRRPPRWTPVAVWVVVASFDARLSRMTH
jgi:hypothetical protein